MGKLGKIGSAAGSIRSIVTMVFWGVLLCVIVVLGYQFFKMKMLAGYYKEGVVEVTQKYQSVLDEYNRAVDSFNELKAHYNEVLARTIITELKVENNKCSVILKNSEGILAEIPVEVNLRKEVFVDYIYFDNRLFIRRVFDSGTAPEIAPDILALQNVRGFLPATIDWSDPKFRTGKSIYRKLTDGTWMITVTGGGALDIDRKENLPHLEFISPIEGILLNEFKPENGELLQKAFDEKINKYAGDLGVLDVFKFALGISGGK
jgi:hypothetical protein